MSGSRSRWFATISALALFTYLTFVLVVGVRAGRFVLGNRLAVLIILAFSALLWWLGKRLAQHERGVVRLHNLGAASLSILFSLVVADVLFSVWRGRNAPAAAALNVAYQRASDPVIWHGELYPRTFYPTRRSFVLYKPDVSTRGFTYGEYYEHRMLASQLLRDSVLEYRPVGYQINRHGLREEAALSDSRIFALGDSYVFGYATDEGAIWPDVLERAIGQDVYNLGVSATGPKQQVQLLEYMLAQHADSMKIEHLLWMIFEGNDLENSYAELRPPPEPVAEARSNSIFVALKELPSALREGSVLNALITGRIALRSNQQLGTMQIDGIQLRNPLYHSAQWGYRLFNPADVRAATRDRQYVREHPNSVALAASLRAVRELASKYGFRVSVVLAPSDVRLYGAAFDGMPRISRGADFLEHVHSLATGLGFEVVNLEELMRPYAAQELLYYRDDHHWNVRGNAVAARLIAQSVQF